jgi:hypothetical protein
MDIARKENGSSSPRGLRKQLLAANAVWFREIDKSTTLSQNNNLSAILKLTND